jgi:Flp pilus assembly protein TadG
MVIAFLALAVVGIDVGHIGYTATAVQTGAEVAATAGAHRLLAGLQGGLPSASARTAAAADAQTVLGQNTVAGSTLDPGNFCGDMSAPVGKYRVCLEAGQYSTATRTFKLNQAPLNSVRATVQATVPNIVAGIWPGNESSTVVKTAIAGL